MHREQERPHDQRPCQASHSGPCPTPPARSRLEEALPRHPTQGRAQDRPPDAAQTRRRTGPHARPAPRRTRLRPAGRRDQPGATRRARRAPAGGPERLTEGPGAPPSRFPPRSSTRTARRVVYFGRNRASARRPRDAYSRTLSAADDAIAKGSAERHHPPSETPRAPRVLACGTIRREASRTSRRHAPAVPYGPAWVDSAPSPSPE